MKYVYVLVSSVSTHTAPHLLRSAVADPELPRLLASSKLAPIVVDRPGTTEGVGGATGFRISTLARAGLAAGAGEGAEFSG